MIGDLLFSKQVGIEEIADTGKISEFNSFIDKLNFDEMPNMNNFRVNISMLSITPCKSCCIIKLYYCRANQK